MFELIHKISSLGGRAFFVGGCVRDKILGLEPKDLDIEVFGLPVNVVRDLLGSEAKFCGESFGVFKLGDLDVSIPRREICVGESHKNFEVSCDPFMSFAEAAERRDLTINAIMQDALTGEIVDPFGGVKDLEDKVIRHTSHRFSEDALRVLRVFQFCARFDFEVAPSTISLCASILGQARALPGERIGEEWRKWAAKSVKPSRGLEFLHACGWLSLFPELANLVGCKQDANWHPEGDVWEHTKHVCDAMQVLGGDETLMWAALLHDIGKPQCTKFLKRKGRICSYGHDHAGANMIKPFFEKMKVPLDIQNEVKELTLLHMEHCGVFSERKCRRVAASFKHTNLENWLTLVEADSNGRPPLPKGLSETAIKMGNECERIISEGMHRPFVGGEDLIERGWKEGKALGDELKRLFELQIRHGWKKDQLLKEGLSRPLINGGDLIKLGWKQGKQLGKELKRLHNIFSFSINQNLHLRNFHRSLSMIDLIENALEREIELNDSRPPFFTD